MVRRCSLGRPLFSNFYRNARLRVHHFCLGVDDLELKNLHEAIALLKLAEDCYDDAPEKAKSLFGKIKELLGAPDALMQGMLKAEIETNAEHPLSEFAAQLMRREGPVEQLALAFCATLSESVGNDLFRQKNENCMFGLSLALDRALDRELAAKAEERKKAAEKPPEVLRYCALTGVTNAFNPDMVFGRSKYSRAV